MADDPIDYQGNSQKGKEDKGKEQKRQKDKEKKIETIVTTPAVVKKKGIFRRAKDTLIEVDFKSTMAFVVADVLIPAAKDMLFDAIKDGAKHSIFGGRAGRSSVMRRAYDDRESHVIYNRGVDRGSRSMGISRFAPDRERGSRSNRYGIDNFILVNKQEADDVLESMGDAIETYQVVSVADLNQMIGIPVRPIDHKWGWTRLDGVDVHQTREGYLIDLPEPEPI